MPYRSGTEREWFLAHCMMPITQPVEGNQPPAVSPQQQQEAPSPRRTAPAGSDTPATPPPEPPLVDCGEAVAAIAYYQAAIDYYHRFQVGDPSALYQARDYWQGIVDQYC